MSTKLILNPQAGSAPENRALMDEVSTLADVSLAVTEGPGDAKSLAARAAFEGYERVIAAGGDGTVNEVLNGLSEHLDRVTLGVLPLGTGNDAARTLGLPADPEFALNYLLSADDTRRIDLIHVCSGERERLAINHVNAGYSNIITERITSQMKQRWGPFAYLKTATVPFRDRQEYHTRIEWDDGQVEVVDAVNVLIANGRTVAGGFRVAPDASLEDGALQAIVLLSGSMVELAGMAARLMIGRLLESEHVISRPTTSLHIESSPAMAFSVDGESFCDEQMDIRVLPKALDVVVGPNYVIEPALESSSVDPEDIGMRSPPTAE